MPDAQKCDSDSQKSGNLFYLVDRNRDFQNRSAAVVRNEFPGATVLALYIAVEIQQINAPIEAVEGLVEFLRVHVREASSVTYDIQDSSRLFLRAKHSKRTRLEDLFKRSLGESVFEQMKMRFFSTMKSHVRFVDDAFTPFSSGHISVSCTNAQQKERHPRRFRTSPPYLRAQQTQEMFELMLACYAILARMFFDEFPKGKKAEQATP
ncbi:MAG: hypothetical protein ABIH21_01475 [Patescibacteria group bacterium]